MGRTRRGHVIELLVGGGLLLGPLAYALTLPVAEPGSCEPEIAVAVEVVERCDETSEPSVEAPEPEVVPEVVPEEPEPAAESVEVDPGTARALILVADGRLVLSTEADASWGRGRIYEPGGAATYRVAKRAALAEIPAELLDWRGRTFDLYGPAGKVCTAQLGRLEVVAQYDGWGLDGVLGYDSWSEYGEPEAVPKSLWQEALWAGGNEEGEGIEHWLMARVESPTRCAGALWARDASLPAPAILAPSEAPNPIADASLAAFAGSEELAELREEYRAWYAELDDETKGWEPSWETTASRHPASARSWMAGDEVALVELDFGENFGGCGDGFDARRSELQQIIDGEAVTVERPWDPVAIFDADLDGRYEYLYTGDWDVRVHVESESEALERWLEVSYDFECPC